MDEIRHWFQQGLAAHMYALEAARRSLDQGVASAAASVRRIARSLQGSSMQYGYPDVSLAAGFLTTASDPDLKSHLDRFLSTLRNVAGEKETDKIQILIVDDDPAASRYIEAALALPNREFHVATSVASAEQFLTDREIALVILDINLPDTDGRELLARIRARQHLSAIPVVVLTVTPGSQARTECFALGADEYIGKPFDPDSLCACVAAKLQRSADLTKWSRLDPLTGLPNRLSLERTYERARLGCATSGQPLSMAIVDIDRLKWVNDNYSHAMGDEVLRSVAAVLSRTLRSSDIVIRWGGEEFVCLFPQTHEEGARSALDKALATIRDRDFRAPDGRTFRVTFSAGVIETDLAHEFQDSFGLADQLLYTAKSSGRNQIHAASQPLQTVRRVLLAEDDTMMATVLRGLLRLNGFEVSHKENGSDALQEASEHPSSLVILDVRMPGADGFEVLERLRKMPGYSQTPILMVSAVKDSKEIARGLSLGANDYITKPCSPVELLARVQRLVKSER